MSPTRSFFVHMGYDIVIFCDMRYFDILAKVICREQTCFVWLLHILLPKSL